MKIAPLHPGEVLRQEFMGPLALTVDQLAQELNIDSYLLAEVVNERHALTRDLAHTLAQRFGTTIEFWTNMQSQYDADAASQPEQ